MTSVRSQGGRSGAGTTRAVLALLAVLAAPSAAPAVILTGGPVDVLPGGGGCTITGITTTGSGATVSCTGVNLAAHTKVYFGIRNDLTVNGNTMTGVDPAASSPEVFRFSTFTGSSITYTSSTTIDDVFHGLHAVSNELRISLTAGSATTVPAGGNPGNNGNGDIDRLFQLNSGSSFTFDVDVRAFDTFFSIGQACPAVYDPSHALAGAGGERSRVAVAFYFSDCGDGEVDSPEQCDEGLDNGTAGSCCTGSCQFRANGETCRPGPGAPCDDPEECTGISGTCPTDDAPINFGNVCRGGSGDSCDLNEQCTGVPGEGCPPDDAPGNAGAVCRVGSAGDICDEDELCTGAPTATCPPDDAPLKINLVCRPGSGDICDPDERCTGNAGQGCPPDIVANPSTVCRAGSGDSCDPTEFCTAIPTQPCPANVVQPNGAVCRAAVDVCDVDEECTGTPGQPCPGNAFAPASTSCDQDDDVCTVDECNGSGACVFDSTLDCEDGNVCTQDSCDPDTGCESTGTPSNSCAPASKAILKIRQSPDPTKDSIRFLWRGGPALVQDMGDPTDSTRYELCVYDSRDVQLAMGVPPGPPWEAKSSGFKYKDVSATEQGVKLIKTKGSNFDKAKVSFVGKGNEMPDTADHAFVFPVTAQLYASDGMCWGAEFSESQMRKNEEDAFNAKLP